MDVAEIANVVAALAGFVAIVALVYFAARPDRDRVEEDDARAYYDRHGSWPPED